jgi:threonine dehydratase
MPIAPTLADGVAGNNERDSITWQLCRRFVDQVVLIDEEGIAEAMRWAIAVPHLHVEPSAPRGIAALRARRGGLEGRRVAVILTGRNVAPEVVREVLCG